MDKKILEQYKGRYVKVKMTDGTIARGKLDDVFPHAVKVDGKYIVAGHIIAIEEVATA